MLKKVALILGLVVMFAGVAHGAGRQVSIVIDHGGKTYRLPVEMGGPSDRPMAGGAVLAKFEGESNADYHRRLASELRHAENGEMSIQSTSTLWYHFDTDYEEPVCGDPYSSSWSKATMNGGAYRIDYIYAKARLYWSGGLVDTKEDTQHDSSYAGALAYWKKPHCYQKGTGYGTHIFRHTGYEPFERETRDSWPY